MNGLTKCVAERRTLTWILSILLAVMVGVLAGFLERNRLEQERLAGMKLNAEVQGVQVMTQTLNGNQMGAIGLLGLINENAKREALNTLAPNSKEASALMENIARAHDADGAYIVGQDGIIKSSWGVGRPLTGVDVRFRPYFQMAVQGKENVYAAIGTTTGRRNLYYAAPLYAGQTKNSDVIGAVVMRTGVVRLGELIAGTGEIALLLSPQKVTFVANRDEWIGRVAGKTTPEQIQQIRQLKQFGTLFDNKDPEPLPFDVQPGVIEWNGERYAVVQAQVNWNDPNGDWTLVIMENLSRSVPVSVLWFPALLAAVFTLLVATLVLRMLRAKYEQSISSQELRRYALMQQKESERKGQLATAGLHMQQAKSYEALLQVYFVSARDLIGVLQGVYYRVDRHSQDKLVLAGSFACAEVLPETIALGDGLFGQCAIERRTMIVETAVDDVVRRFATIRSGLGDASPSAILISPVMRNDQLLGVVELALLLKPTDQDREQLEALNGLLAMNVEIVNWGVEVEMQLANVLAADKVQAERLAFQQTLIDTIPYPVFYKNAEARFVGFNRAYEEIFGVNKTDLIGKRVLDLDYLPEADRLAYQAEDEATITAIGQVQREMQIPFADGKLHDTLYFVSGFPNADGSPGGLVGTFIDISEQKEAMRELNRLADLERFHKLAQGREERILELKREINTLAKANGQSEPYATVLVEPVGDHELTEHPDYRTKLGSDGMTLHLADLVDLDELQVLFTGFCESIGIAAAIIDLEGKVLASSRWQRACTDFHRVNPDSCARCIESDTELAVKLRDGKDYTMYTCKNGMTDCASPIIVEGQHLANVFIGQFHLRQPEVTFFTAQARQFGYDEKEYLKAVHEAPVMDEKRLPTILGFLSGFAHMISTMSLAQRRADLAQKILADQAVMLKRERVAALSLAEDAVQARNALACVAKESQA